MFRRKRPLYRAALANQPFLGQDGTLERELIMTTSCLSVRSVCLIAMPLTVVSVWKLFHMVLKTTRLDCGIKIMNDQDSQKRICPSQFQGPNGRSLAFCGITAWTLKSVSVCFSQRCAELQQAMLPSGRMWSVLWTNQPQGFPRNKKAFPTEIKNAFLTSYNKSEQRTFYVHSPP